MFCLAGNFSLAVKRRKAILFKIDSKLSNFATSEAGAKAEGLLFGKVFLSLVFGRAGRSRGHLSCHSMSGYSGVQRGSFTAQLPYQGARNASGFVPSRSRTWGSRQTKGSPSARRPYGKPTFPLEFFSQPRPVGEDSVIFCMLGSTSQHIHGSFSQMRDLT